MRQQLCRELRSRIQCGSLRPGWFLPASRGLARQLEICRNTVIAAYEQLLAEGYVETWPGVGTRVAAVPHSMVAQQPTRPIMAHSISRRGEAILARSRSWATSGRIALHPGYPELAKFPFSTWARLVSQSLRQPRHSLSGYHCAGGHPRLREAIAGYLRISRGVNCVAEQVIVTAGAQAALDLIARLFLDEGDIAWMEEPGYAGARNALLAAGARLVALPVGPYGWQLDAVDRPAPRLVFVTPSCQMPLGVVMATEQRLRLLAIAERYKAWIIEDDYDGEYRFRGQSVPAIQGFDRSGLVIYVGTFSKVLFPALRMGFLVAPPGLAAGFEGAVCITGQAAPLHLQEALANFILEGHFSTHLRRMRQLYAHRLHFFTELCEAELGRWVRVEDCVAGMQAITRFTRPFDDREVAALAFRLGVDVEPLSFSFSGSAEHGLRVGFAGFAERDTLTAVRGLREAFRRLERTRR